MDSSTCRVLSLCSGGGGLDRGFRLAVPSARVVCHVEIEFFACAALVKQMEEGSLDSSPVWSNLKTFDGKPWRGAVDCIVGGFPCTDLSRAGKQAGIEGEHSSLWFEFARIIGEVGPRLVFVENVSDLLIRGIDRVLGDLAEIGFDAEWGCLSAADVGAPHLRERIFIVAHANGRRWSGERSGERSGDVQTIQQSSRRDNASRPRRPDVEHADRSGWEGWGVRRDGRADERAARATGGTLEHAEGDRRFERGTESSGRSTPGAGLPLWPPGPDDLDAWRRVLEIDPSFEPSLCRVASKLADRCDRLRVLGNGVVPLQAASAFSVLEERAQRPIDG